MSVIITGKTFANGEQLTADKLNQVIDQATFNANEAVDGSTLTLIGGAMAVNDNGITEDKIYNGAVTKAKIENVDNMKVLGNTSGSAAAPEEVDILDEDDMSSDSATAIATQQSIKAYVDDNGITQTTGTAPYYGCRAFASYNGITQTLKNGSNIDSVVRNSAGKYTVNFDVNMPDVNYSVVVGGSFNGVSNVAYISALRVTTKTTSSFTIEAAHSGPNGGYSDQEFIDVAVFR